MTRWQYLLGRFNRQLWARSALYGLAGVATALLAGLLGPLVHLNAVHWLGSGAVEKILTIMASSMLAVATFSLSTMVSAFSSASSGTTPRASQLLVEDTTAQRALSTFIGSFLFSIVGLIALSAGVYDDSGRVLLFVVTLVMIGAVVVTLLSWVDSLQGFGRVSDTLGRIERATRPALLHRIEHPHLGGAAPRRVLASAIPVCSTDSGHVRHVDIARLQEVAEQNDWQVHLGALPGSFVEPTRPLVRVEGAAPDDAALKALVEAFVIGPTRTFEQDPRFGLVVLGEVASRALSPAVNDPGTAIAVLGVVLRLLVEAQQKRRQLERERAGEPVRPAHPRVHVPGLDAEDVLQDVFNPIARDGAGLVEVGIKLQRALAVLRQLGDAPLVAAAEHQAAHALERAEAALTLEADRLRLRAESLV